MHPRHGYNRGYIGVGGPLVTPMQQTVGTAGVIRVKLALCRGILVKARVTQGGERVAEQMRFAERRSHGLADDSEHQQPQQGGGYKAGQD